MENFLGSGGVDGSRTDLPVSWNFLGAMKSGKTPGWGWEGQSRLAGKGGRFQQLLEKLDHFPGLVLLFLCTDSLRISIWEYPAPEFLWEVAQEFLAALLLAECHVGFALLPEFPDPPGAPAPHLGVFYCLWIFS